MSFMQWFRPKLEDRPRVKIVTRATILPGDVESAPVPNQRVAEETTILQTELVQSLLQLGRSSSALKLALSQSTLNRVNGSAKNHI